MVTRGNNNGDTVKIQDGSANTSSEDASAALQESSPFRSQSGLDDVRMLTAQASDTAKPLLTEVGWSDAAKDQQDIQRSVAGDSIAEMITRTRTGQGQSLEQLRKSNPELAAAVDGVAEKLSKQTPEQMNESLKAMRELYRGYDGLGATKTREADNAESVQALREAKMDPALVQGIFRVGQQILEMPEGKRQAEYQRVRTQTRLFHLD